MPCTASARPPKRSSKKGALRADRQGEPGGTVPAAATLLRRTAAALHPGAGATGVRHRAWPAGAATSAVDGGGGGEARVGGAGARVPAGALGAGEKEWQRAAGGG